MPKGDTKNEGRGDSALKGSGGAKGGDGNAGKPSDGSCGCGAPGRSIPNYREFGPPGISYTVITLARAKRRRR